MTCLSCFFTWKLEVSGGISSVKLTNLIGSFPYFFRFLFIGISFQRLHWNKSIIHILCLFLKCFKTLFSNWVVLIVYLRSSQSALTVKQMLCPNRSVRCSFCKVFGLDLSSSHLITVIPLYTEYNYYHLTIWSYHKHTQKQNHRRNSPSSHFSQC